MCSSSWINKWPRFTSDSLLYLSLSLGRVASSLDMDTFHVVYGMVYECVVNGSKRFVTTPRSIWPEEIRSGLYVISVRSDSVLVGFQFEFPRK